MWDKCTFNRLLMDTCPPIHLWKISFLLQPSWVCPFQRGTNGAALMPRESNRPGLNPEELQPSRPVAGAPMTVQPEEQQPCLSLLIRSSRSTLVIILRAAILVHVWWALLFSHSEPHSPSLPEVKQPRAAFCLFLNPPEAPICGGRRTSDLG